MPEVRHKKFVFILTKNVEAEYYRALVVSSLADKLSQIQKTLVIFTLGSQEAVKETASNTSTGLTGSELCTRAAFSRSVAI